MLVSDFDYELPPESIAQEPAADRAASKMLRLIRTGRGLAAANELGGSWQDRQFREFPDFLRRDDLLVLNNTRVFPARLFGRRSGERAQAVSSQNRAARDFLRGRVEVLLTRQISSDPNEWECLVRPGRKIGVGERLFFDGPRSDDLRSHDLRSDGLRSDDRRSDDLRSDDRRSRSGQAAPPAELEAEVTWRGSFGERRIRFRPTAGFFDRIDRIGHVPLPPYIDREDLLADRDRYQTVYARTRGSVAAPTAGLHFTSEILERIRARGIEISEITLHVGLGTFQPVRVEKVEEHKLHREFYEISAGAARAINEAKAQGRRVVAVGTTTVRTLEFAAGRAGEGPARVEPSCGEADIFIYPGYGFRIVDALLTNFHLPQSTLLMLVCAFASREAVLAAYRHAVEAGYRFYSYGDCMFIE